MKAIINLVEYHKPYQNSVMKAKVIRYANGKMARERVYEQVTQSSLDRINGLKKPLIDITTDGFTASYMFE